MSKLEYISTLTNKLTNIYKLGGVKQALSDYSCNGINPSTYTCGRLFARLVQKVAFVVSISFLLGACGNSIPSSEREDNSRSEEKKNEAGEIDSWERGDSASYIMNGVPVSMK